MKAVDKFVRARKQVKADRATKMGIAGHKATMNFLGNAAGNPSFAHIDSVLSQVDGDHEQRKTTQMFTGMGAERRQPSHVRVVPSDKE